MKSQNDYDGFVLIELILVLVISGMVLYTFINITNIALRVNKNLDQEDDLFFSVNYLLNYIEKEIYKADEIYLMSDGKYKIIFFRERDNTTYKYNYYTYTLEKGDVYRMASNRPYKLKDKGINRIYLDGKNRLSSNISNFTWSLDKDKKKVEIRIDVGSVRQETINKTIYFECEVKDMRVVK